MGAVLSPLRRGIKNFNAENRAMRLLMKDKLPIAPPYPSMVKKMAELEKDAGESLVGKQNKLHRKNDRLLGMLQDIRVDSTDPLPKTPDSKAEAPTRSFDGRRPLPKDTKKVPEPESELESQRVESVPPGRLSVYMAQELLVKHKQDPKAYNADRIATDYRLDTADVGKVLEYFRTLTVVPMIPEETLQALRAKQTDVETIAQAKTGVKMKLEDVQKPL